MNAPDESSATLRSETSGYERAEQTYRALFETMNEGFCVIEECETGPGEPRDFRYVEGNPAFVEIAGRSDLMGKSLRESFPDDAPAAIDIYTHVLDTGEAARFEYEMSSLGRSLELHAFRPDGRHSGRVGVLFQDITERNRAQALVRDSEELFREFAENSSDAIWILNTKTKQLEYLSPAFERIWGASRDRILANLDRWSDFVHPEDREQARSALPRLLAGETYLADYRIVRPDGEVRWIRDVGFPIRNGGAFDRAGGIAQDVTDLKGAEWALRESEERYRLIVENARYASIFTTDADFIVTDWHEGAQNAFGYAPEEIIGGDARKLFTPEDQANLEPEKEAETAARTGKADNVRWHLRKDGSRVFIEGVSTALRDAAGDLIGFLKVGLDATERRRTMELQHTLLGELQHRVRNTLAVVRSIARRTAENSDSAEDMLAHFQGRLDAFSRVQAALTRRPEVGVELTALIEDELVAHAAREGENVQMEGPEVTLDGKTAERMSLAVHELTTNAVKHGALSKESGRITINWQRTGGPGKAMLVFVWQESGLEMNGHKLSREGFGMELLRRSLPYDLDAETTVELLDEGLRFEMTMPLRNASANG